MLQSVPSVIWRLRGRRRIGLRFAGDAHIGGSDVPMGVPTTGLEYLLMVSFPTGLVYMTGGMVGTGVQFMFVGGFLTDFGYIIGSLLGADLVVMLMTCVFTGVEDGGDQSGGPRARLSLPY